MYGTKKEERLEGIIAAGVTGLFALAGVIITNMSANKKIENSLSTAQELTNNEIKHLTEEVKKHNSFAERIPVIETELKTIDKRVTRLEEN